MPTKVFTRRPERELTLHRNEQIIFVMQRHIVHLLVRLLAPGLLFVASATIVIFRGVGGQFFVGNAVAGGQANLFDLALLVGAGTLLVGAVLARRRPAWGALMVLLAATIGAWLVFRLRGGRVLWIDPFADQGLDAANLLMLGVTLITGAICVYLYLDWKTDEFILTSNRVIYNSERPFVRRRQEQIPLANIQQVEASTNTYLQHWLKLGTLRIKSAAFGFMIFFEDAYDPDEMQRRIMNQVKKVRREETDADLQRLVESALDGRPASEQPQGALEVDRTFTPGLLQWLLPHNPQIDREQGVYTWRRHWIFLVKAVWLPLVLWLVLAAATTMGLLASLVGGLPLAGLFLLVTLLVGAWAAWQVEDHRNDRYILTPTQVVDLAKRPLGPENRRTASLDALQNVTYRTTLIGRIFGYGDVLLQTAGSGEEFTYFDAPRPSQIVDLITSYQLAHKRRSKIRSLEDTVKLIQYYDAHFRAEAAEAAEPRAREVGGAA
ncbi:MAG TPA: PH domain-containing protein [Chloroflexaceae bacterium]|nr:PH domain-containing protein [Chloroflexaceae bacterium]